MISASATAISLCAARSVGKRFRRSLRDFIEFHDQILDHRRLDAGMAEEAEAIVAALKQHGFTVVSDRQYAGTCRQYRAVAHIDGGRKSGRQSTIERVCDHPMRVINNKTQRRLLGAAARGRAQDAGADTDADDRQSAIEKAPGQPQFRAKARHQIAADDAQRAGAEHHQTIEIISIHRHDGTGRERPAIAKADIAALEMILDQAEIVGFDVLKNA